MSKQNLSILESEPPVESIDALLKSKQVLDIRENQTGAHPKPSRMKILEIEDRDRDLIFKGIRPDWENRALDFLCDIVCADLGQHLNQPVVWQVPVVHSDLGLGLVSPYLDGDQGIAVDDLSNLQNGHKIRELCVFEEWVMNTDDKSSHFRTISTNNGKAVCVFDHGHTLHQANNFDDPEEVESTPKIEQSVGNNPYEFTAVSEVLPGVELIKSVDDKTIFKVLDRSFSKIRAADPDDLELESLVQNERKHTVTINNILRERRRRIDQIMENKFGQ